VDRAPLPAPAGRSDAAPTRGDDEVIAPLPLGTAARLRLPPTPFVGRDRELALLEELLADRQRRLVTVVGAPGAGKTRLAVEAARRSAARFPDGVIEVSLAALADPALVAATLLAAAGGLDAGTSDAFTQLVRVLGEGSRLLLVDNTEHLPSCGPLLARLLDGCPELSVLATSRQPLAISAERVMPLDPLDAPDPTGLDADQLARLDAVRLLDDRLRAAGAEVDVSAAGLHTLACICRMVDGLPLAIELAAARGRSQSVPGILAALEQRLAQLDRGPRDAEPRHRTMRDAVSWSVELLDPPAALAFRHAGVFAGRWTVAGLAAVTPDLAAERAADALDALVDRSLVVAEPRGAEVRYRMLAVVREAARELMGEEERGEAARRHALHMLGVAQLATADVGGAGMRDALDTLEEERDDLRAALSWAVRNGEAAVAEGLCLAQRMLWYVRGPLHEGCEAFAAALALPLQDAGRRSRVLSEAAALERQRGGFERAASLAAESTALARTTGDAGVLSAALLQEGFVAHLRGEFAVARALLDESARLAEEHLRPAMARIGDRGFPKPPTMIRFTVHHLVASAPVG
jgi:predicted ATPase